MLEEFLGIPTHPLLVHAAVIFVPLQVLGAIGYAFLPSQRHRIGWAAAALVVVGPATAWLAKESGEAFQRRLVRNGLRDPNLLDQIARHENFADTTVWAAALLAVLTVAVIVVERRTVPAAAAPAAARSSTSGAVFAGWALRVLLLAGGIATAYYVFRTGDSGAHIVWQDV